MVLYTLFSYFYYFEVIQPLSGKLISSVFCLVSNNLSILKKANYFHNSFQTILKEQINSINFSSLQKEPDSIEPKKN